jgi:ApaG protein
MGESTKYYIEVIAEAHFVPEQSTLIEKKFYFAYDIQIINKGSMPAKLLSRHWFIVDGSGQAEEVQGVGVVGEQPYLQPGESFEYTSYSIINTPVGSMYGTYEMLADDGTLFMAEIKPFRLAVPGALH